MADTAVDLETIDDSIDLINKILTQMVADDVTSDTAQLLFIFNPNENVWLKGTAPIVLKQNPVPEGEIPEPMLMVGMNIQFEDTVVMEDTISASFPIPHKALISTLTLLRDFLGKEQKKLDYKMTQLIKTKKGQPN